MISVGFARVNASANTTDSSEVQLTERGWLLGVVAGREQESEAVRRRERGERERE